jgi:two-component sensor histidine kinase
MYTRWLSRSRFSRWTIGARIIAIVLALAVPLNLVIAAVVWHLAEAASEAQRTSLLYSARSVAASVDAKLGEFVTLAQVLARSPALLDDKLDAFNAEAHRAFESIPDAWLLVADLNGQQLINTARRPGQPLPLRNPASLPAQRRALETRSIAVGDVLMHSVVQDWIISIEAPVFKDGQPFRSLALCVKARSFLRLLNDKQTPKNWLAAIADRQGRIIARVPNHERYAGQPMSEGWSRVKDQEGVFEFASLEGDPIVLANAHSAASGWPVAVAVKQTQMKAAAWDTIRWATILGGGLSALSLLCAGLVARRITRPITELEEKASALLFGRATAMPPQGPPEVTGLWESLKQSAETRDRSVQALRESEAKLHLALDAAELGIWRWEAGGTGEMHWDARCKALFGVPPNEPVTYEVWANCIPPEDRAHPEANIAQAIDPANPNDETLCEYRVRHPDGPIRWVSSVGRAFFEPDPAAPTGRRLMFMAGAIRDVTETHMAEAARRERERHDRYFLELDRRLREAMPEWEAINTACEALGRELGAGLAGLAGMQPDGEHTVVEHAWSAGNLAPPLGRHRLADGGAKQIAALFAGDAVTIEDVLTSPYTAGEAAAKAAYAAHGVRSSMGVALLRNGPQAFLFVADAKPRAWTEAEVALARGTLDRAWHAVERARAEEAVRESEERERQRRADLETILAAIPAAVFIAEDPACARISANSAARELMRLPEGANASLSAPESEAPTNFEIFSAEGELLKPDELPVQRAVATGQMVAHAEFELRFVEGDRKYVLGHALPLTGPSGEVRGAVGAFLDITERKRAEQQIHLLMREVNHRSKNMLTIVQAVARQTVAATPEDFIGRFAERVQALAASQDLLVKNEWRGVDLSELIRSQLAHFKDLIGERIELKGPPLSISASAAQTMGMALHELATNAGKYGALSNQSGRVTIAWGLEAASGKEAAFVMSWRETGGPPVTAPDRQGFGSTIIAELAETSLDAKVALDFAVTGLSWRLQCPALEVLDESKNSQAPGSGQQPEDVPSTGAMPRILVVEDEPLVALEMAHILKQAGFDAVGPARTVAQALELIKVKGCDAAVLDINLGKETSELVALELTKANTPFISVSGYSRAQQPAIFEQAPALTKPVQPDSLLAAITGFLAGRASIRD